eukprot:TRINITY_DN2117_c1_g1_i1.p1 TRINITY_DN2117_c1_g1~~TRINITY_DN2117_c1_g1_i1.p1  ORF type:complete len:216 (-),score=66.57 TRINITY_DN2117_c1_g1_i1:208-855(-)
MKNFSAIIKTELKDNQESTQQKHKISCKNCARLHHKCDKIFPSCSHCLKKGVKCEVNTSVKKRGRPFGTTKENIELKKTLKREFQNTQCIKPEVPNKKLKIPQVQQQREINMMSSTHNSLDNNNSIFFQVPIDINWEFSFQDSVVLPNNNVLVQNNSFQPSELDLFFDPCDFSESSSPSSESYSPRSTDDFILNVDNLDFDTFNSFLVEQEYQFC